MSRARPMNKPVVNLTQAEMYDIIRRPVVTEKSTLASQYNQVTFLVITKTDLADAEKRINGRVNAHHFFYVIA